MPYALGIDLGTARTVAAVSRNLRDSWSEPVTVPLDATADRPGVASVLHFTGDDTVEVGDAGGAQRADRVARDFLDRVGDEVPLALGGQHYPAESLAAALVAWVVDRAEALEGTAATHLVVTHPVGWGAHRRAAFQAALRELNLPELTMLPRPVAAAEAYAATERLEVGEEVAVYSLGAGRFEAAVLRRGSFGFELRSHADSTDVLGGSLFDDLLAEHATTELGEVPAGALAAWRAACVAAKERLTSAVAVTIPAPPGAKKATVSVNRTDFETLVRPVVEHTVRILQRAIAGADSDALRAVVLVGGCANVPLIAELVSAAVRVRVVAADDPTTALARGAALAAGRVAKPTVQAPAVPSVTQHTDLMRFDDLSPEVPDLGPPPPRPPVELAPLEPPTRGLARLTRRIRPTDDVDEEERPSRKRREPDRAPLTDSDVLPADNLAEDEQDGQEVELLTHTRRPDKDADYLAHLRADDPADDADARPRTDPSTRRPRDQDDDPRHPGRRAPRHKEDLAGDADFADRAPSRPGFVPADLADRAPSHPSFAPADIADRAPSHPGFTPADLADRAPSHPSFTPADIADRAPSHPGFAPAEFADQAPSHPSFPPARRHEPAAQYADDLADQAPSHPSFPPVNRHAPHHGEAEHPNFPPTGHRPAPDYTDDPRRVALADQAPAHPSFSPAGRRPTPHHGDDPTHTGQAEPADQPPAHPSFPPAGRQEPTRHRPALRNTDDAGQAEHPNFAPAGHEPTGRRPAPPYADDPVLADVADQPAFPPANRHGHRHPDNPTDPSQPELTDQAPFPPANRHGYQHPDNPTDPGQADVADQPAFPPTNRHNHRHPDHSQAEHPNFPPGHRSAPRHEDPADPRPPARPGRSTPPFPPAGHEPAGHRPAPRHNDHADHADHAELAHPSFPAAGHRPGHEDHASGARHDNADFPDQRTTASRHHEGTPGRRRRAEPDDAAPREAPARHAELPGPRNRSNHAAPAGRHHEGDRHAEDWQHDEPALAQRHRRRRRDDFVDGDA